MLSALIRTLVEAVVAWILVTLTIFSAVAAFAGYSTAPFWFDPRLSPAEQERAHQNILDEGGASDSVFAQYSNWVNDVIEGEFGRSTFYRRSVSSLLPERLEATSELLWIGLGSALLAIIIAQTRRETQHTEAISRTFSASFPAFWVALVLLFLFGVQAGVLPLGGRAPVSLADRIPPLEDRLEYIALPALVLFTYAQGRFLLVLRKNGGGFRALASELPALIATIVVLEIIFSWPGLGRLFIESLTSRDIPVMLASLVYLTTLLIAAAALPRFFANLPRANDIIAKPVRREDILADSGAVIIEEPLRAVNSVIQTSGTNESLRHYRLLVITLIVFFLFAFSGSALTDALNLNPTAINARATFLPPLSTEGDYPLGTDDLGRDALARVIVGAQNSLGYTLIAALVAVIAAFILSRVAPVQALRSISSVFYFTPALLLAMALLTLIDPTRTDLIRVIAALFTIPAALLLFRQLPIKMLPVFAFIAAHALLAEAVISYLGLGIQPPAPSLGNMLTNAQVYFLNGPHLIFIPGIVTGALAFLLLVFSCSRLPNEPLYRAS